MYSQHVEGRLSYSCRTYPKCKYIIKVHGLGNNNQPLSKSPWHHIPHPIEFQKPFQSSKSVFTVITFKATIPKKILVFRRGPPGRPIFKWGLILIKQSMNFYAMVACINILCIVCKTTIWLHDFLFAVLLDRLNKD